MNSGCRRLQAVRALSCLVLSAGLAFPASAQRAPATGAPTSDGAPMPAGKVRHDLGGRVTFGGGSYALISAPRPPIPAADRKPFTAAEILAVAPADRKKLGVKADGSDAQVLVKQINPDRQTWRSMTDYLGELNKYESWLNGYGYTLRDGVLKTPQRAAPGGRPSPRIESDLGLKFALLGMPPSVKAKEPTQFKRLRKWQTIYEPAPTFRDSGVDRVSLPADVAKSLGAADAFKIDRALNPSAINDGALATGKIRNVAVSGPSLKTTPLQTLSSTSCPDAPCTLKYGVEYTLSPKGQSIVNNDVVYTKYVCKVINISATKPEDCGDAGLAYASEIRAQDYYPHSKDWLASYQDLCRWIGPEKGPYGLKDLYVPTAGYKPDQETSSGKVETVKGDKSSHLYKGILKHNIYDVRDCLPGISKNFLFGAHACLYYSSLNGYEPKKPLNVREEAGIDVGVSVFGLDVSLVEGQAAISWTQSVGAGSSASQPGAPAVEVKNPIVNSSLEPQSNKEYYKGPEGTVLIGPVPLTISSFLEASLNLGGATPSFKAPPLQEMMAGKEWAGVGEVKLNLGAQASVWGGFDAAIDAFIASAGVSGKLSFLETTLGGFVGSKINPADNDVLVEQGYGFEQSYMNGAIDAFVELDLIIYTKRWSVEIVRFDPFPKTKVPMAVKPFPAFAVDPDTVKVVCE